MMYRAYNTYNHVTLWDDRPRCVFGPELESEVTGSIICEDFGEIQSNSFTLPSDAAMLLKKETLKDGERDDRVSQEPAIIDCLPHNFSVGVLTIWIMAKPKHFLDPLSYSPPKCVRLEDYPLCGPRANVYLVFSDTVILAVLRPTVHYAQDNANGLSCACID
jgi:hypothetical protein